MPSVRGAGVLRRLGLGEGPSLLEHNLRANTVHGAVQAMGLNLVQPFIGIFAVRLGASNYQIALLSSVPAIVGLMAMVPGARFADRFDRKKRLAMTFIFLHRLFFLALVTVPLFTPDRRAAVLVALVGLMNLPGAIGNVTWQSFVGGIIPAQLRPGAFAARNRAMSLAGTSVVLVAGRVLDLIPFPLGYQIAFVAAFLFAAAELWVLNQVDEDGAVAMADQAAGAAGEAKAAAGTGARADTAPAEAAEARPRRGPGSRPRVPGPAAIAATLLGTWREVSSHRPYLRYTAASIFFYFVWQTAWPLFTLYQVRVLGANNLWVSLLNLANTGGSLVGFGFWARYANRHGNLRTLFAASAGIFVVPVVYAFSTSLYMIAAFNILTGAIFAGVGLSLFNALLDTTPDRHRTSYIAYYNTLVNLSAIAAPVFGVALLGWFGFRWAFLICAGLRVAGSLAFLLLDRMEAATARLAVGAETAPGRTGA